MRERTTWSRQKIANQLKRVAEDPRAMNQDHLSQQPAADDYVIGGPSEFAEDVAPSGPGWKADLGSDGNTKRDEIGMPEYRKDTFNNPEKSPGVSPSRQASHVYAKAEVATKVARLMLPRTASEQAIEDQGVQLMELSLPSLRATLARLAQQQSDDGDEDDGQSKEASDDDDDDDDEGQSKQAKDLPPEFLENIQKKKDEAKAKDDKKKEARRRLQAQQQQEEDDDDEGQSKEARARKAQQDDEDDDEGQSKQARARKAQQQSDDEDDDKGQAKEARLRKAQQDDSDEDEEESQSKQARSRKAQQDEDDDGGEQKKQAKSKRAQDDDKKQAQGDDPEKKQSQDEKQVGKEAYALIKQAAADLLSLPLEARRAAFKVALPGLVRAASQQLNQLAQDQIQSQVQDLVQNAMQQQVSQQQAPQQQVGQQQQVGFGQQQTLADDALVDQMLQDPGDFSEEAIQLDAPEMDLGLGGAGEDPALQQIFASDLEVQSALEAKALESGHAPTAKVRTASTRTVGTRPSSGVSLLGGGTAGGSSSSDEINRLAGMWSTSPDVSSVFRS